MDVIYGYEANWIDPRQESVFTTSLDKLKAELTVTSPIFDTSPDAATGQLRIFSEAKHPYLILFRDKRRSIEGPWIIHSENGEPRVVVDIQPVDKPGVTDVGQTTFAYKHDPSSGTFDKLPSRKLMVDVAQEAGAISGTRIAAGRDITAKVQWQALHRDNSHWTLNIKKGSKTLVSGPMKTDELGKVSRHGSSEPHCYGPYVRSLDGSGQPQIDLRYEIWVDKGKGETTIVYERIYFYDNRTRKLKSVTQFWGENNPRFADLRHDGRPRFVTEDWQLQHDAFNDFGGPLQIWEWTRRHKLLNVTRQFPQEIRKHAKVCWDEYQKEEGKERTNHLLLSYYGDLCLVGESKKAISALQKSQSAGEKELHQIILGQLRKYRYL